MNKPKISVIVPVYNVDRYLEICIDSLINQTYDNLEIILINDGSTDDSKLICEKYLKLDKRIKLINQKNKGVSSARNNGIRNSSGEYIEFVDSTTDEINEFPDEEPMDLNSEDNLSIPSSEPVENPESSEDSLPSPADLDIGDMSDMTNPNL